MGKGVEGARWESKAWAQGESPKLGCKVGVQSLPCRSPKYIVQFDSVLNAMRNIWRFLCRCIINRAARLALRWKQCCGAMEAGGGGVPVKAWGKLTLGRQPWETHGSWRRVCPSGVSSESDLVQTRYFSLLSSPTSGLCSLLDGMDPCNDLSPFWILEHVFCICSKSKNFTT